MTPKGTWVSPFYHRSAGYGNQIVPRGIETSRGTLPTWAELQGQRGKEGHHEAKHRIGLGLIKQARKCCLSMLPS